MGLSLSDTTNINTNDVTSMPGWDKLSKEKQGQLLFQQKVQQESEAFSFISSIMKMLHDAFMAYVQNLK